MSSVDIPWTGYIYDFPSYLSKMLKKFPKEQKYRKSFINWWIDWDEENLQNFISFLESFSRGEISEWIPKKFCTEDWYSNARNILELIGGLRNHRICFKDKLMATIDGFWPDIERMKIPTSFTNP